MDDLLMSHWPLLKKNLLEYILILMVWLLLCSASHYSGPEQRPVSAWRWDGVPAVSGHRFATAPGHMGEAGWGFTP